jgi:hypothetical protein
MNCHECGFPLYKDSNNTVMGRDCGSGNYDMPYDTYNHRICLSRHKELAAGGCGCMLLVLVIPTLFWNWIFTIRL